MLNGQKALSLAHEKLPAMTGLLEEVVLINSHTANKEGVDLVGEVFRRELAGIGLEVETIPQPEHGDLLLAKTRAERPRGGIMLCGHMDTVFPKDTDFNWFVHRKDKCFGPGVADMKGGLVVAVFALAMLEEQGLLHQTPITFLLNSDEEIGSPISGPVIKRLAKENAAALVFECGGKDGQVVTGRKGKLGLKLEVNGQAGHAGFAGAEKASALLELAHKTIALEALNNLAPGLTLNVGVAKGGSGANVIAESAEALIDVRLPDKEAEKALMDELARITREVITPGTESALTATGGRPPMPVSQRNLTLFACLDEAAKEMGLGIDHESRGGVSDANYIASMGTPVLDGLGPVGGNDHSDKEYIIHHSLAERAALTAVMLTDLAGALSRGEDLAGS